MTRNLIVLGCAALLAIGLSFGTFAGSVPDADSDGVPDQYDNCDADANGPLSGACDGQQDGDVDGYGNECDSDVTNNLIVDLPDLGQVINCLGQTIATCPAEDVTCNGIVDLPDLGKVINDLGTLPGTSALSCAGTIPCFAQ